MAGDDGAPPNNEILGEGQAASVRGEPHSRVGGILECDPPGNKNSSSERACDDDCDESVIADDSGGGGSVIAGDNGALCRYAIGTANTAMSFIEVCQVTTNCQSTVWLADVNSEAPLNYVSSRYDYSIYSHTWSPLLGTISARIP